MAQSDANGEMAGRVVLLDEVFVVFGELLVTPDTATAWSRIKFTLWFIAATAFAAMLFYKPFLIWKNSATPPWCLWAMSVTAGIWLLFYLVGDVLRLKWPVKIIAFAGQNVLLAYLLSEAMESVLNLLHLERGLHAGDAQRQQGHGDDQREESDGPSPVRNPMFVRPLEPHKERTGDETEKAEIGEAAYEAACFRRGSCTGESTAGDRQRRIAKRKRTNSRWPSNRILSLYLR